MQYKLLILLIFLSGCATKPHTGTPYGSPPPPTPMHKELPVCPKYVMPDGTCRALTPGERAGGTTYGHQ